MTWGVLLMAYGSARGPEDVRRYYTHIRHGHPPTEEQLNDLLARYEAIGGVSPLFEITQRQGEALQAELSRRHGASAFRVYLGMKHSSPFIGEAIEAMRRDGVARAIGLVLAPHYSSMSIGTYLEEAETAIARDPKPFELRPIRSWADAPGLIELLKNRILEVRARFSQKERDNLPIIFSAHSLPQRILSMNDPYPGELRLTGDLVAQALGTTNYTFSWQSAGRTREPWMGPDILDKLSRMAEAGYQQAVICPAGFVSDHLEVLYDIDVQAQEQAAALGMHIERTRSLNDDPAFIHLLADLVEARAQ
ncbi:ferrochelatase [Sulfobacillus harzensis]|uniref:Coproporphyrin III ferrochelatase n=1 Tax=Sulfobacillus harzensis TaxID=2729629 RepID=A0A7Y0L722_9FIRM|nr:ferrochelatase [Sulfobacillus harzensis]NMP23109.1 ferrochelatase [Sulfobacillus harzensis]